mgnify:FL=1
MDNDTICALASPAGGAIATIRISGTQSIGIADKVFRAANHNSLADAKPNTIHFGNIVNDTNEVIDEVLVSVFRAPHSYTGEDSIEISCHGSSYIVAQVLQVLIGNGCRQAQPGEYTMRAYLNGKMDLSQAEAVADLIASTNKATHHIAMSQLKGHFSSNLSMLRDKLLKITSLLELELDFSDHEELEFANRDELLALAEDINKHIERLCNSFASGQAIKGGVPVAIIGKTNVGKSTLLNQLVGEDRAIVSDVHGTTRDIIEDTTVIQGVTFRFIDTAGIRQTKDRIEQLGIQRTYAKLNSASIILWVTDKDDFTKEELDDISDHSDYQKVIIVRNKIDLCPTRPISVPSAFASINISAKDGINLSELRTLIYSAADIPEIHENDVIVTSARHYSSLCSAKEALTRVIGGLHSNLSGDLISEDLRQVLYHLSEITGGAITPHEVLGNIFSHFCIGK